MRAFGSVSSPPKLGLGDHVCWAFDTAAEFSERAVECLSQGIALGQRVAFVAPGRPQDLRAAVESIQDVASLLESGGVQLFSLDSIYGGGEVIDPDTQVRAYARATEDAVAAGFTGFRVVAEATSLVRTSEQRESFLRYEHLIDRFMANSSFSAMCAYDRSQLGDEIVAQLACLHPVTSRHSTPFQVFALGAEELGLAGEVDYFSAPLLDRSLELILGCSGAQETLHVDARGLRFIDHRGLTSLNREAARSGRVIEVRNASSAAMRLLELLGLSNIRLANA